MFENIVVSRIIRVIERDSMPMRKYVAPTHLLVYKISGTAEYGIYSKEGGRPSHTITMREGDAIYVSPMTKYDVEITSPGRYLLIGFDTGGDWAMDTTSLTVGSRLEVYNIIKRMLTLSILPSEMNILLCQAKFYELLACFSRSRNDAYFSSHDVKKLDRAMVYMQNHIFDPELTVSQLSDRAGMSETYFRKLFRRVNKLAPMSYILLSRLSYARALLEADPLVSVNTVARTVGYTDALYFSKAFKKMTGYSPREYRQLNNRSLEGAQYTAAENSGESPDGQTI